MKRLFLFLYVLFLGFDLLAQDFIPEGIYLTVEEFVAQKPSKPYANLTLVRRTDGDIKMSGGNDYKFKSEDKRMTNRVLKTTFYAIVAPEGLFINCQKYKLQNWYAFARKYDKYIIFKAGISADRASKELAYAVSLGGPLGGGIAGAQAAMIRRLYVLDIQTNKVRLLNEEFLNEKLKDQLELLSEFKNEADKTDIDILSRYFIKSMDKG